jgi:tRNA(Ile)-lysidine synthase
MKYGYSFFCKSENIPKFAKENKLSEEEAGRQIRYNFFQELAEENGKIATAHNQNDNAETLLMRFMRGTGLCGLCGIDFKRDRDFDKNYRRADRKEFSQKPKRDS